MQPKRSSVCNEKERKKENQRGASVIIYACSFVKHAYRAYVSRKKRRKRIVKDAKRARKTIYKGESDYDSKLHRKVISDLDKGDHRH